MKAVERYVEAVKEARALTVAYEEEPTPFRAEAVRLAWDRVRRAAGPLNGSQLGQAKRQLEGVIQGTAPAQGTATQGAATQSTTGTTGT